MPSDFFLTAAKPDANYAGINVNVSFKGLCIINLAYKYDS